MVKAREDWWILRPRGHRQGRYQIKYRTRILYAVCATVAAPNARNHSYYHPQEPNSSVQLPPIVHQSYSNPQ